MKVTRLGIEGLLLVELVVHGDARGFFVERFQADRFRENGLPTTFAQDNHSRSGPGVLRGLHFQHTPAQGKLVGVLRGRSGMSRSIFALIRPPSDSILASS